MRSIIVAGALLWATQAHAVGECMSPAEAELVQLVNAYRVQNGLTALPASRWLGATGQWHAWDRVHNPGAVGNGCNTHSWSSNPPVGVSWQGVCYTPDHAQAEQMWRKPFQISAGRYINGNGYELAADSGGVMTAQQALLQWQNSPSHNPVILQQGPWAAVTFTGVGVGIRAGYAVAWFGDGLDPDGAMVPCPTDGIFSNGFEG